MTAVAALLAIPATAAPQALAQVSISDSAVTWSPTGAGQGVLRLRVTGPQGFVMTQELAAGEAPSFSIFDAAGGPLADGVYNYELWVEHQMDAAERESRLATRDGQAAGERRVQSGAFTVRGGAFVDAGAAEGRPQIAERAAQGALAEKDQVILDDLIVDGSICAGLDCVNGESFGFDTLRLKENNLRIKFQDTSSTASFPSNDWQLTANDSSNGGQNKFSIDDIDGGRTPFTLEAGAPSHSLYVDDGGRIGFGTSTPVVELHVKDGDTPTLRLEQDGSSGFTAQTWDVAGNEAGFFVRDVTNGSTLPFRILLGAASQALVVDGNSEVGIGAGTNPGAPLHVLRTNGTNQVLVEETGSPSSTFPLIRALNSNGTSADRRMLQVENNGPPTLFFNNTGITNGFWTFTVNNSNEFQINAAAGAFPGQELRLTTAGNLIITGTLTTAGAVYPDYVFDPGYPLMPLGELKGFIEANGHLPKIPTAEESAGMINVSEMQLKLLEKVEELTLYTLAQEETIHELRARLAALEGSNP